ncbi:hypothetical protein FRC12_023747 [Ceratobasidium sp. 428]|nr:hypothetical protein FRC12_023747 [Ceratobasidium sp. 428]
MVEHVDMNNDANGANRRKLLDTLNSLRAMGFSKELELPNMVCVGSQSVGKSSLIEALSGINLPRQSGTCTRHGVKLFTMVQEELTVCNQMSN